MKIEMEELLRLINIHEQTAKSTGLRPDATLRPEIGAYLTPELLKRMVYLIVQASALARVTADTPPGIAHDLAKQWLSRYREE